MKTLERNVFCGCSALTSITIPNSVTSIGEGAFEECSSLKSITIPNSVKSIGEYVFEGCSALTSITIPDGLTIIEKATFYECTALASLTIPANVDIIGAEAFYGCSSLATVSNYATTPQIMGADAFAGIKKSCILYVPEGSIAEYKTSAWGTKKYFSQILPISDPEETKPSIADGDYLIENIEGGYLGGGNDWGTHATLLGKPQWFTATVLENGKYTLDSHQSNGGDNHYLAGDLYTDGAAYEWTITEVGDGVYTIANADGKLITASDGMNNLLSLTGSGIPNSAKWKFVLLKDVLANMNYASENNPVDVTSLIKDPELKRNGNNMWNAWIITGYDGESKVKKFSQGQNGNVANCAESWHSSNGFKAVQTIPLPKAGVYTLTAQGFYRQDNGMEEEPSYLFAGEQKSILPNLTGTENNMVEAYAAFLAKKYTVTPIVITATQANQAIEIGFAGEATNMWNIFGELELKYYGTDAPGITGIDHISVDTSKYGKILENGKIVIIKDGKRYNVNGVLLK